MQVVARVRGLTMLNGSAVRQRERRDCELRYLRAVLGMHAENTILIAVSCKIMMSLMVLATVISIIPTVLITSQSYINTLPSTKEHYSVKESTQIAQCANSVIASFDVFSPVPARMQDRKQVCLNLFLQGHNYC